MFLYNFVRSNVLYIFNSVSWERLTNRLTWHPFHQFFMDFNIVLKRFNLIQFAFLIICVILLNKTIRNWKFSWRWCCFSLLHNAAPKFLYILYIEKRSMFRYPTYEFSRLFLWIQSIAPISFVFLLSERKKLFEPIG